MSKRLWKKVEKNRKRSNKRAQQTGTIVPAGVRLGPNGGELVVLNCKFCGYPTRETWLLSTGESGCEMCVLDESEVMFCAVQEMVGDELKMHLLGRPSSIPAA